MNAWLIVVLLATAAQSSWRVPVPPLGLPEAIPTPPDNPLTAEGVALGRQLFADTRLSGNGSIACITCHQPHRAFTDGLTVAVGIHGVEGRRNTPTLVNRAFGQAFSLDARIATLEQQVLDPIANPLEMDLPLAEAARRVGRPADEIGKALASYVRTILSGNSRVDRFLAGDADALTREEQAGLLVFQGEANCVACHAGPNFTDERVHNTGVAWTGGRLEDRGAGDGAFKTPTLREIALTGPYMHNGSFSSLSEVIDFYDRVDTRNPRLDPLMRPLGLSQQSKHFLQLFLMALSGDVVDAARQP